MRMIFFLNEEDEESVVTSSSYLLPSDWYSWWFLPTRYPWAASHCLVVLLPRKRGFLPINRGVMRGDRGLNKECIQGVLRYMGVKENIGYLNRQTKYKGHCTRRVMSQGGGGGGQHHLTHFGYTTAVSRAVLMKCCMAEDRPSPWCCEDNIPRLMTSVPPPPLPPASSLFTLVCVNQIRIVITTINTWPINTSSTHCSYINLRVIRIIWGNKELM